MVALVAGAAVGLGVGVLVYLVAVPQRPALAPLMKLAGSRPHPRCRSTLSLPQRRGGARGATARHGHAGGWTSTG